MEDLLAKIKPVLKEALGTDVSIRDYHTVVTDLDYSVLIASLSHPNLKVVIKLAGPNASRTCAFERTAAIYRLIAAQTSIPVPEVIATDETCQKLPMRYAILTYIPGQEWAAVSRQMNPAEQKKAYEQIGTAVASLHQIRFDDFGDLNSAGQVQAANGYGDAVRYRAAQLIKNPQACDYFLNAFERHAHAFRSLPGAALSHEDLHPHNILFRLQHHQWELATILDFDKAWAGSPEADLARMELWNMTGVGFWQAYHTSAQVDPCYAYRRPLYQLFWCLEYAAASPKHLADTRRICLELGLRAIVQFEPFLTER